MRYFRVWLDKGIPGGEPDYEYVAFDGETEKEIEEECADVLDTMIGNLLDTGWDEVEEGDDDWREAVERCT